MTPSEEESIIDLLAEGLTAQEIADATGSSTRTVNFRLQILYAKHQIPPGKHRAIKLLKETGRINGKSRPAQVDFSQAG